MPTPKSGYFLKDGSKVPGVTTIIGKFKESSGLIQWAYKMGREHEGLARQGKEAPRHLYDVVEDAANIGTQAHKLVEIHIDGGTLPIAESIDPKAWDAYGAYLMWEKQTKLKITEQEMQLVSEKWKFGGTPDAVGTIGNELCLVDWKTSNSVYLDHLVQLAAYRELWNENHPDNPLTGGSHLCRFAKDHGDFAHHYYPNLDEAWRAFVLMRELYDITKELKKRAA